MINQCGQFVGCKYPKLLLSKLDRLIDLSKRLINANMLVVFRMDHTIVHFGIPAEDVEKLRSFYSQLFGWKIEKTGDIEYWMIQTVPADEQGMPKKIGVSGGMIKKQTPEHKVTCYIQVESIDEYTGKIESLGGKIIVPKIEVPNMLWWAMALDPEGNHFAILEEMKK